MASVYSRIINYYKFKYQTIITAMFDKYGEDDELADTTDLHDNLKDYQFLTQSDTAHIIVE